MRSEEVSGACVKSRRFSRGIQAVRCSSTKRSSMAFLVQMGLPLSSDDVVVDVVVDGDGDGDELHRQSLVSIATVRASNSIP